MLKEAIISIWEFVHDDYITICILIVIFKKMMGYFNVYKTSTIYDCPWVIYFLTTIGIISVSKG
jgi:hypothetical protein